MKQIIASSSAPGAIGPYSQAVRAGNSLYISGQIPIDPATGEFAGNDIVTQTRQSLKNIGEILKAAGMDYGDVVKTTVLLQNRHFTHRSTKRFFLLSVRSIWSSRSSTSASASVRSSPVSQWGLKAAFSKSSVIRPRESPH